MTSTPIKMNGPGSPCCCPCWRDTDKTAWEVTAGTWLSTNRTNASNSTLRSKRESLYRLTNMQGIAYQNGQELRFGFCSAAGDEVYGKLSRSSAYAGTVEIFKCASGGSPESIGGPYSVALQSGSWMIRQLYDDTYCRYSLWNGLSSVWKIDIDLGGTPCAQLPFTFVGSGTLPSGYVDFWTLSNVGYDKNCICRSCPPPTEETGVYGHYHDLTYGPTEFDVTNAGFTVPDDTTQDQWINGSWTTTYRTEDGGNYELCIWAYSTHGWVHVIRLDYNAVDDETRMTYSIEGTVTGQIAWCYFRKQLAGRVDARTIDETFDESHIYSRSRIEFADEGYYYSYPSVRVVASP